MPRLTALLIAFIAVLGFAVAWVAVRPMPPTVSEEEVRSIVSAALGAEPAPLTDDAVNTLIAAALSEREASKAQSLATIDADTLNPMIEDYLLSNPRILQRVSDALQEEIRTAEAAAARVAIASMRPQIFEDPDDVVLGNPDGDVTLVELYDYNCGFCRQAVPDLATLLAEDPNLKLILKEFPILSQDSVDAARVGVLVAQSDADYWQFYQTLYTARGQVGREQAMAAAQGVGLNLAELELGFDSEKVTAVLDKGYALARGLAISGTPTFIIGDEIIPGAIGLEGLRQRIANMRACGKTVCDAEAAAAEGAAGTEPGA